MENMKIDIPNGYCIDKEASDFDNGIIKFRLLPRQYYYINEESDIKSFFGCMNLDLPSNYNLLPTKEYAKAILAYERLICKYHIYNYDITSKYVIAYQLDKSNVCIIKLEDSNIFENTIPTIFRFEEAYQAEHFINEYKELFEECRILFLK